MTLSSLSWSCAASARMRCPTCGGSKVPPYTPTFGTLRAPFQFSDFRFDSLTKLQRTGHPGVESSVEKVLGSEIDQRLQELGPEVLGPAAFDDPAWCREFLYSRSETIMGGTSEIQRNVIAQRMLGLPR